MLTISTKELRNNFSSLLENIAKGKEFFLIHRSKIVAEIKKPQNIYSFDEASELDIENSATKDISEDFCTQKELDYYMSLKQ